ncbi:L-threonine-O-3-phosphate decarboxylase [Synechococcus sp. BL107]|uniref:aminotransferase class I/II-fold pyridoxal phosphate-dependent enzyme n=1 Tax=Synechococcus sp. BL107 TaxID=313625 RepID=UPI0000E53A06|nr:aminotransferase class I/II-fold pyridoxal phosphate-dependent enzyme [Synechococcus sp. BL107]EAU71374.1 L-threonine-O-3-phosphate decarboxylase [Synechococcus sp. BL107]
MASAHGGEVQSAALRLGVSSAQVLDASASLVPWTPRFSARALTSGLRDYPDRHHHQLVGLIARIHGLETSAVAPGNGAAELFTWAGRDAAALGISSLPAPGFADYSRALACWQGRSLPQTLALQWDVAFPQPFPPPSEADVLWICNPHNPTGQLWSRESLEPLLQRYRLVICDEAFLSLVPDGEQQSLIPLVSEHPNLVVIRSLTKLYGIAGLRLGYAIAQPERLQRWAQWRDPWPVNGIASAVAEQLLASPAKYQRWCRRAQSWVAKEGAWMQQHLAQLPGITPMPSAANFLLIHAEQSLVALREAVEQRHRILLRDCRSFEGLGECWLRIGLQSRRNNRRIIRALKQELDRAPLV